MTNQRLRINHMLIAAAAVGALTIATDFAQGAISHVSHTATRCRIINGAANQVAPGSSSFSYINPAHPAGDNAIVSCPLDRFNISNTNGLQDLDVRVFNFVAAPKSVTCTAVALRPTDATLVKTVTKTVAVPAYAGPNTGHVIVDFGSSVNVSAAYGSYYVECEIPTGTGIANVLMREY
jgi:hypothetical protein